MEQVFDYRTAETFDLENTRLFDLYFHFGAHRCELSETGDFFRTRAGGHDIVLYNDSGTVIAFENRCPHRGCLLIPETSGNAEIVCPYHGWRFGENRCIVPNKNRFEGLENPELTRYSVGHCGDFIFFSPSPAMTLKEQLGSFWEMLETISYDITAKIDDNDRPFGSNWKIALENALENYHVSTVHPSSLGTLSPSDGDVTYDRTNSLWISSIQNTKIASKLLKIRPLFENRYRNDTYFSLYLFPFSMVSSTFGYSYAFQTFFPQSPDQTAFLSRTYATRTDYTDFYDGVVALNRQIFDEDARICALVQEASLQSRPNVYNSQEQRILAFQKHYKAVFKS